MDIEYTWLTRDFVLSNEALLKECCDLYSEHYGIWGEKGHRPGMKVKLSIQRLRQWFENDSATLYYALHESRMVGYAIAFSKKEHSYGVVTWVTQLVVHSDYRHQGIAKSLLFSIWGFSDHYAWGIVSANPYAVRALEKATRRRAVPIRIKKNVVKLQNIGKKNVPFIDENTVFDVTDNKALVDTHFSVDYSDTIQKIVDVTKDGVPWALGDLQEGWEWFAFTFNDQSPISLTKDEIEHMIATSDSVVQTAYSRMILDANMQKWMKNTINEVDYIDEIVSLDTIDLVYDLGCGSARHSFEIAKRGIHVIGVDYVEDNVNEANARISNLGLTNIQVIKGDCRYFVSDLKASLVLCLYDVVGTYSSDIDNIKIIKSAYDLLKPGGIAVFSVMNYVSTIKQAKYVFSFEKEPDRLLDLPVSNIQETTGEITDPDYYLVDSEKHLVYRKERFSKGRNLPAELIVKDKRYTKEEIIELCISIGFTIVEAKYTNASGWNVDYSPDDRKAKEILVVCRKEILDENS